jgi:hypothetical protein
MKRVVWLLCGGVGLGCSATPPGAAGAGSTAGVAGLTAAGSAGSGAGSSAGGTLGVVGGAPGVAGSAPGAGVAGVNGVAGGGMAGLGGGGDPAGSGGSSGGTSGAGGCVPDPAGNLSEVGDTVHDAKTCLDWMKLTKTGVNYAAADTFCSEATLGGFDDWRIPTASELGSTVTLCGKYPPDGPIDSQIFDLQGDGYWTTTPAGEPNKVCAVGMLNAGGYYHYGTAGPQVVRCVRGTGSVKPVADCTTAQGCSDW